MARTLSRGLGAVEEELELARQVADTTLPFGPAALPAVLEAS